MIAVAMLLAQATVPCVAGTALPIVVRISGFKTRAGQVRVRLFGDPPSSYFDKRRALVRVEVPVPRTGAVEVCVAAPRPGTYAVDVRHDVNGDGRTDRGDGGGASGNPHLTLWDMLLARKPPPATVRFRVNGGVTVVDAVLMYLQGASFRPVGDGR